MGLDIINYILHVDRSILQHLSFGSIKVKAVEYYGYEGIHYFRIIIYNKKTLIFFPGNFGKLKGAMRVEIKD
jgi:hypothetical protein